MRTLKQIIPFVPQEPTAFLSQELSRWNDERSKMRPEHFSIFEPDVLLPVQYHRTRRTRHLLLPEQKLALAILEDAVACYQHYAQSKTEKAQVFYREAEAWIMRPDNNRWIFSFERICDLLTLNPDYIRNGLRRWRVTHQASTFALQPLRAVLEPRAGRTTRLRQRARPKGFARPLA